MYIYLFNINRIEFILADWIILFYNVLTGILKKCIVGNLSKNIIYNDREQRSKNLEDIW